MQPDHPTSNHKPNATQKQTTKQATTIKTINKTTGNNSHAQRWTLHKQSQPKINKTELNKLTNLTKPKQNQKQPAVANWTTKQNKNPNPTSQTKFQTIQIKTNKPKLTTQQKQLHNKSPNYIPNSQNRKQVNKRT